MLKIDQILDEYKDRKTIDLLFGEGGFLFQYYVESNSIADDLQTSVIKATFGGEPDQRICKAFGTIAKMVELYGKGIEVQLVDRNMVVVVCALIHKHFVEFADLLRKVPDANFPLDDMIMFERFYHHHLQQTLALMEDQWIAASKTISEKPKMGTIKKTLMGQVSGSNSKLPDVIVKAMEDVSVNALERIRRGSGVRVLGGSKNGV